MEKFGIKFIIFIIMKLLLILGYELIYKIQKKNYLNKAINTN